MLVHTLLLLSSWFEVDPLRSSYLLAHERVRLYRTVLHSLSSLRRCFHCCALQVSKEGDVYEVPVGVAKMSNLVATTIDDDAEDDDEVREIPLPNVKDAVLAKVIEFCTHYKEEPMNTIQTPLKSSKIEDLVQPWYAEYVKVEQDLLFELVTAANFMDIKPLLDLTCLAVSVLIKVSSIIF